MHREPYGNERPASPSPAPRELIQWSAPGDYAPFLECKSLLPLLSSSEPWQLSEEQSWAFWELWYTLEGRPLVFAVNDSTQDFCFLREDFFDQVEPID